MDYVTKYIENVDVVVNKIRLTQQENIQEAADIIANTIENEGIIQAFGTGHSFAGALEIAGRAGGFIQTMAINDLYTQKGWVDAFDGESTDHGKLKNVEKEDCFIIISNSGRNELHVKLAKEVKKLGCKLIVITNMIDAESNAKRGDSIINYADVVIDNCGFAGDCSIEIKELAVTIAPTSSIAVANIATMMTLKAIELLMDRGVTPPIYKSTNIDGGPEYNEELREKYKHRLLN